MDWFSLCSCETDLICLIVVEFDFFFLVLFFFFFLKLVSLNIGSCSSITDEGLKQLSSCTHLQDLNIWRLEV